MKFEIWTLKKNTCQFVLEKHATFSFIYGGTLDPWASLGRASFLQWYDSYEWPLDHGVVNNYLFSQATILGKMSGLSDCQNRWIFSVFFENHNNIFKHTWFVSVVIHATNPPLVLRCCETRRVSCECAQILKIPLRGGISPKKLIFERFRAN